MSSKYALGAAFDVTGFLVSLFIQVSQVITYYYPEGCAACET